MVNGVVGWLRSLWPTILTVAPSYLIELPSFTARKQFACSFMVFVYDITRRRVKEAVRAWMPPPSAIAGLLNRVWPWLVIWVNMVVQGVEAIFSAFKVWAVATSQELVAAAAPIVASFVAWAGSIVRDARVVIRWPLGENLWPFGHARAVARAARPLFVVVIVVAVPLVATPVSAGCVHSGETMVCGGGLCDLTPARDLERLLLDGDAHAPTPEAVLDNYPHLKVRDK
jgi:hypothetical protein